MTMERLRAAASALHNLAPEGLHLPHMHGTAADRVTLEKKIEAHPDPAFRAFMRKQLSQFTIVHEDDAGQHADTAERLLASAKALVSALGLEGPGVHGMPKGDGTETPGVIAEADAVRYVVKSLRELRHAIGNKAPADVLAKSLPAFAEGVAKHLGTDKVATVLETLKGELKAFSAEGEAAPNGSGFHEDVGFVRPLGA